MITLKNVKILNEEIERLKDFEADDVSPAQREAINRYFKIRVDDLQTSDQAEYAGQIPDIEDLINNG